MRWPRRTVFFYKLQIFSLNNIRQLFSRNLNYFLISCIFCLQSCSFFKKSWNFFLKSCNFFLQTATFFYNLTNFFCNLHFFSTILLLFSTSHDFFYKSPLFSTILQLFATIFQLFSTNIFSTFFNLLLQRYRNSLIKPRIIENWNLRLRTLNKTRTQAEEVVGQNGCPEFRTLDTRPNIVHLLAINWEPKPEVKTSFSSNLELYWSPMYCPESIIAVNSYLSVSLSKYLWYKLKKHTYPKRQLWCCWPGGKIILTITCSLKVKCDAWFESRNLAALFHAELLE